MDQEKSIYGHHRVLCSPRLWRETADLIASQDSQLSDKGGRLYGIWRSQIGRPRDELTVMTLWVDGSAADAALRTLFADMTGVIGVDGTPMEGTLRPESPAPPRRQGNYAFRSFTLPEVHWSEFLDLCSAAWPGFESAYDSQVIGLWSDLTADAGQRRALLLTRRPDLAMWERSKLPEGEDEAEVRRKLSRRYDLCDSTEVYTTTLLTADDRDDTARWT